MYVVAALSRHSIYLYFFLYILKYGFRLSVIINLALSERVIDLFGFVI